MDSLEHYRQLIRSILIEHTKVPYKHGDIKFETVFDPEQDHYLLMILGREPVYGLSMSSTRRVHGCLIHIELSWDSVLEELRKDLEFAVA